LRHRLLLVRGGLRVVESDKGALLALIRLYSADAVGTTGLPGRFGR
jgi:hypothetical protein